MEQNRFIDPVQEFRTEMATEFVEHLTLFVLINHAIFRRFEQNVCPNVRRHDDNRIFEVDDAPVRIGQIVEKAVGRMSERLTTRSIHIEITDAAKTFVADEAYEPQFGARPINRYVQRTIETKLARSILAGEVEDGQTVIIDVENGALTLRPSTINA
jgi:hypothetical protein